MQGITCNLDTKALKVVNHITNIRFLTRDCVVRFVVHVRLSTTVFILCFGLHVLTIRFILGRSICIILLPLLGVWFPALLVSKNPSWKQLIFNSRLTQMTDVVTNNLLILCCGWIHWLVFSHHVILELLQHWSHIMGGRIISSSSFWQLSHCPFVQLGRPVWMHNDAHTISRPILQKVGNASKEVLILLRGHDSNNRAVQP